MQRTRGVGTIQEAWRVHVWDVSRDSCLVEPTPSSFRSMHSGEAMLQHGFKKKHSEFKGLDTNE